MDFEKFKNSLAVIHNENKWSRPIILALIVSNLLFGMKAFSREVVVTITPPEIHESLSVGKNSANEAYKKAWAGYLAGLIGNVQPKTLDFTIKAVGALLSPEVYDDVHRALLDQAQTISSQSLALTFAMRGITYEPETDKVFVQGESTISGSFGSPLKTERTYEMIIKVGRYQPQLQYLATYDGGPKLTKRGGDSRQKKRDQEKQAQEQTHEAKQPTLAPEVKAADPEKPMQEGNPQ